MTTTRHIDWTVALLMAVMMWVVFPVMRWIDHEPIPTLLLLGFFYLCYIVNRRLTVPLFFKRGSRRLLSFLIFAVSGLLMSALTYYHEGWPFYQLADSGKVTLGQQRTWLFFLVVQITSVTIGIIGELSRQRISLQAAAGECDRLQQALAEHQQHQQEEQQSLQQVTSSQTFSVKSGRQNVVIPLPDILYIESKDNYVFLNLTDGRQVKTLTTLTALTTQLPADEFVRIHKSFIVGHRHVSCFNNRQVIIGSTVLPVGRTYSDTVRQFSILG